MQIQEIKNSIKVSIIVPVYNVESYIEKCISSILSQTFIDFELLLIDDGSTDNSGKICDQYKFLDKRVCVIHKKNGGVSEARNVGIRAAKGKYIMFCDGDDCVERDWCQTLFDMIEKNPLSYCLCNVAYVFMEDNIKKIQHPDTSELKATMSCSDYYDLYKSGLSGYVWNKIYLKSIIIENNIYFTNTLSIGEDVVFNTSYFKICDSIKYCRDPLYLYFHRTNSASHSYMAKIMEQSLEVFNARIPYIDDLSMPSYCKTWLFRFINELNGIFDKRNSMSLWQCLKYNQKMICTKAFQYCITHADCSAENTLYIKLLKSKNYYLVWLFNMAAETKRKIFSLKSKRVKH